MSDPVLARIRRLWDAADDGRTNVLTANRVETLMMSNKIALQRIEKRSDKAPDYRVTAENGADAEFDALGLRPGRGYSVTITPGTDRQIRKRSKT